MNNLHRKNIKIFLNYIVGPLLFIWLSYSIYTQIRNQPRFEESWFNIKTAFSGTNIIRLILVFVLMLINWSLEALKWKFSVQPVQPVSFYTSLKAIFSGVAFSLITPNRTGEYIGRVLYMNEGNRLRVISLSILCSLSQLIITIFFGLLGLAILKPDIVTSGLSGWPTWINIVLAGGSFVLLFLTVFYFRVNWLAKLIDKLPGIKKYNWLIRELEKTDTTLLTRLLSISLLRYIVFTIQYYLLFDFFGIELSWWQGFWATALVFFIMAITPTIALFEIVQKVYFTEQIFGLFTKNMVGIGVVTTTVWFINLVTPALIGSLLILGIKLFKKHEDS